jgi:hypothetical protein
LSPTSFLEMLPRSPPVVSSSSISLVCAFLSVPSLFPIGQFDGVVIVAPHPHAMHVFLFVPFCFHVSLSCFFLPLCHASSLYTRIVSVLCRLDRIRSGGEVGNREDACKEEVPQIRRGDLLRGFMQKAATCQWSTCHACKSKADAARIGLRATHLANF